MSAIARRVRPKHKRSKPRRGHHVDRPFRDWLHTQKCWVEEFAPEHAAWPGHGCWGQVTVHHLRHNGSPKDDRLAIPLCIGHHLHDFGLHSIERGRQRFAETFGFNESTAIAHYNAKYSEVAK